MTETEFEDGEKIMKEIRGLRELKDKFDDIGYSKTSVSVNISKYKHLFPIISKVLEDEISKKRKELSKI